MTSGGRRRHQISNVFKDAERRDGHGLSGRSYRPARLNCVRSRVDRDHFIGVLEIVIDHSLPVGDSLLQSIGAGEIHPVVIEYAIICDAYRANDRSLFNEHLDGMTNWFANEQPNATKRTSLSIARW